MTDNTTTAPAALTPETVIQGRHYLLVTDGSGPVGSGTGTGGWACVLQLKHGDEVLHQRPFAGQVAMIATNVRMEMTAPLAGLRAMKEVDTPVLVQSDNTTLIKGMNIWMPKWKVNGWKGSSGPVANRDLWDELDAANQVRTAVWEWVRGHNGHALNELADKLARNAAAGRNVDENGVVTRFHAALRF